MADKITEESLKQDTPPEAPEVEETPSKPATGLSDTQAEHIAQVSATDPKSLSAAEIENFFMWKKRKTQEMLENEPKIRIFIPFNVGEDKNNKANQYAFFGINGYNIQVRKGQYVEVPQTIANMHMESMAETEKALDHEDSLSNISMKIDEKTGQKKSIDALL